MALHLMEDEDDEVASLSPFFIPSTPVISLREYVSLLCVLLFMASAVPE